MEIMVSNNKKKIFTFNTTNTYQVRMPNSLRAHESSMKDGLYVVGESHNREAQQHNSYSTSKQVRMQVFGSNAPAIVVPPVPGSLLTHELTDHCTSSNYLYNSSVESIKTDLSR